MVVNANLRCACLDRINDLKLKRFERLGNGLGEVKQSLQQLAEAGKGERGQALKQYWQTYRGLQGDFGYELNEFKLSNHYLLRKPLQSSRFLQTNGWAIYDRSVTDSLQDVSRTLTWFKRGFWGVELMDGGYETFDAYRQGKDWATVAVKESMKIGATYVIPEITDVVLVGIDIHAHWLGGHYRRRYLRSRGNYVSNSLYR